jgi:serine/threonine-protein kinase
LNDANLSNQLKSGQLGETRVADVLTELEASEADSRVWFETEYGVGEVLFHQGKMLQARLGGARGQTALLRLLAINEGKYGIEIRAVSDGPALIDNVKSLVELHGTRKAEWKELCSHAPPLSSVLRLTGSGADVRDSSRGIQRVVFVLIDGRRTLMQILDESSFDPVEALRIVARAIDDGFVQHAPQSNSLFPLASMGESSGVLPRFATPAPMPRLDPSSTGLPGGPPSWRHSTLVGLGKYSAKVSESSHSLAPSPIIDLGRSSSAVSTKELQRPSEVPSMIKTVIAGFGLGKRGSAARANSQSSTGSSEVSLRSVGRPENGNDLQRPIIGLHSTPRLEAEVQQGGESGPPSEEFAAAAAVPNAGQARRFVDRYEILLRIGRGGMGTVYLCRLSSVDVGFQRLFALKLLRSHLSRDTQAARDFLEEARLAGHLHNANVVAVCDAGFHVKQPYLVMDYVEGCSFKHLMTGMPSRAPYLLLPIVIDALAGLHAAHTLQDEAGTDLKLVHCDVSPENMLVGVDGTCRLTDFGVARKANRLLGATTRGKPGYVSPEQIEGQTFDHRADIFSMGVVLWNALTGKRLFSGATVEETLAQVCNKPIPPPSTMGTESYPALDAAILRALARDPKDRYNSAEEMLSELGRIAMAHDGLATTKETAAWVREAAGSELTQRRLAILDASRSTPSIRPLGDTTNGDRAEDAAAHSPTKVEFPSALSTETGNPVPPTSDREPPPEILYSTESHEPSESRPPGPSSVIDVSSLFYGKDDIASSVPPSVSSPCVRTVSKSPHIPSRVLSAIRNKWLLLGIIVLAVGVTVFIVIRSNSRKSAAGSLLNQIPSAQSTTSSGMESADEAPPSNLTH